MSVALLFAVIVLVVFGLVFALGRRIGPLTLALAAGSLLVDLWASELRIVIGGLGIGAAWLPDGVIASLVLLLLPMVLLLFGGPIYYKKSERVVASLVVGVLTAALLVRPLGQYMALTGDAKTVYQLLSEWWPVVATLGIGWGLLDVLLLHTVKVSAAKKKH